MPLKPNPTQADLFAFYSAAEHKLQALEAKGDATSYQDLLVAKNTARIARFRMQQADRKGSGNQNEGAALYRAQLHAQRTRPAESEDAASARFEAKRRDTAHNGDLSTSSAHQRGWDAAYPSLHGRQPKR